MTKSATTSFLVEKYYPEPRHLLNSTELATIALLQDSTLTSIHSPLNGELLYKLLCEADFPNLPFARSVCDSLILGGPLNSHQQTNRQHHDLNHQSARENPEAVTKYFKKELEAGRFRVVTDQQLKQLPYFVTSPLGVVLKEHKARVIVDMTASSLNDSSTPGQYGGSLHMDRIPHLLDQVRAIPRNIHPVLLTEDVTAFFRQFPVRPSDQPLQIYDLREFGLPRVMDQAQSFGGNCTPVKCCHFLDLVCWWFKNHLNVPLLHYVDNCFLATIPERAIEMQQLIQHHFAKLGIPLNPEDSSRATSGKLLGFWLDLEKRSLQIPPTKLKEIQILLTKVLNSTASSLEDIRRLSGLLTWSCQVIFKGMAYASFIWRWVEKLNKRLRQSKQSKSGKPLSKKTPFPIPGSGRTRQALEWFNAVLAQHTGTFIFHPTGSLHVNHADSLAVSDSSKLGAAFHLSTSNKHVFSFWKWCSCCVISLNDCISTLELATILVGLSTDIGSHSRMKDLTWETDNQPTAIWWKKGYSKQPIVTEIIQEIHLAMVTYNINSLSINWVPRTTSRITAVDLATRGDCQEFLKTFGKSPLPILVPPGESRPIFAYKAGDLSSQTPATLAFFSFHRTSCQTP